jgi:hypothetical protein
VGHYFYFSLASGGGDDDDDDDNFNPLNSNGNKLPHI